AAGLVDDAALVAVELRFPRNAVGHGETDDVAATVDGEARNRVDLVPQEVGRDVRERFSGIPAGDEEGGAEDLRRPGNSPAAGWVSGRAGLRKCARAGRQNSHPEAGTATPAGHMVLSLSLGHALNPSQREMLVQRESLTDPAPAPPPKARGVGETEPRVA